MQSPWISDETVHYYRIAATAIAWFGIIGQHLISSLDGDFLGLGLLRFFSLQTNWMVAIWLTLALLWRGDERYNQLGGRLRSALVSYITITFAVYHVLLSGTHNPTGLEAVVNFIIHYVTPLVFIADFVLTERQAFGASWPLQFLVYPLSYLGFVLLLGGLTGFWPYFFVELPVLGLSGFLFWVVMLLVVFAIVGYLYYGINYLLTRADRG